MDAPRERQARRALMHHAGFDLRGALPSCVAALAFL